LHKEFKKLVNKSITLFVILMFDFYRVFVCNVFANSQTLHSRHGLTIIFLLVTKLSQVGILLVIIYYRKINLLKKVWAISYYWGKYFKKIWKKNWWAWRSRNCYSSPVNFKWAFKGLAVI